jgi:hypothetical protein
MLLRKYENEGDENQLRQIRESINRIQVKQINKKAGN